MLNCHLSALIALLLPLVAFTTPGFCEELSREQQQRHVLSMEKLIQILDNQKELETATSQLSPVAKNHLIQSYADHVNENLDPTRETERKYLRFLRVANHLLGHNQVCKYFYNCVGEGAIINTDGLTLLIKRFQEKRELGEVTALAAEDLPRKLNQIARSSSPLEKTFLVWHGEKKNKNIPSVEKHITPLFVRKTNEGVLVIVTDSAGNARSDYNDRIKEILKQSKLKDHNLSIYMTTLDRQKDSLSCPVFSLLDARQHFKSSLFKYIDEYEHLNGTPGTHSESGLQPCSRLNDSLIFAGEGHHFKHNTALPAQVLQHVQTFSKIKKYLNTTEQVSEEEADRIMSILDNHRYTENNIAKSGYVRKNAYLFYNELLKNLIKEKAKKSFFQRFYEKIMTSETSLVNLP